MNKFGFTLIELLIVIAIIAILALIAIPNFLEAQTRAKVARAQADMRSVATAMEAYVVDHNKTPLAVGVQGNRAYDYCYWLQLEKFPGSSLFESACHWLTTPIAYTTSFAADPFAPKEVSWISGAINEKRPAKQLSYGLISLMGLALDDNLRAYYMSVIPPDGGNWVRKSDVARQGMLYWGDKDVTKGRYTNTTYALVCAGPDRDYNHRKANYPSGSDDTLLPFYHFYQNNETFIGFTGLELTGRPVALTSPNVNCVGGGLFPYDPSNGTVSYGDIIRLSGGGNVR